MDLNDPGNRVVGGVVVALLVIGAWYLGHTDASWSGKPGANASTSTASVGSGTDLAATEAAAATSTALTAPESATTTYASGDSVVVNDQTAGTSVQVASVTLSEPTWIAVRDSSGRTLGAGLFPAGTHTDVTVDLLRGTIAGQRYQVLLYADNGDKQFSLKTDMLVMGPDGSVPGANFSAK